MALLPPPLHQILELRINGVNTKVWELTRKREHVDDLQTFRWCCPRSKVLQLSYLGCCIGHAEVWFQQEFSRMPEKGKHDL